MSSEIKDGGTCTRWIAQDPQGLLALAGYGAVITDARGDAWQYLPIAPSAPGVMVWHKAGSHESSDTGALWFPVQVLLMQADLRGRAA